VKDLNVDNLTSEIKKRAYGLGFDLCGIALARPLGEYEPHFKAWIESGMNDRMGYLARDIGKRLDPADLLPGARSLVVTGLGYYADNIQKDPQAPILSRYVYGKDYHSVITWKLEHLLSWIRSVRHGAGGKAVVDTAPISEKAWAAEAGLGWQGKHSIVINKDIGSFFFIGILILNIELDPDPSERGEYCGKCRLCLEACPTGAINENRTIDARKCIANLTIENRGPIPEELIPLLGKRVYGCDRCQEVCPWNKNARPNEIPEFNPDPELAVMTVEDWKNLPVEKFNRLFRHTAAGRLKYAQFISNINAVTG